VASEQLRKIADIADRYGGGFVHFVVRGSPEIPRVDRRYLEDVAKELQEVGMELLGEGLDNLQSCFGGYCTESNANPQALLRRIESWAQGLDLGRLGVTISAAGCPNSCGIAHLNDIGFYGVVEPEVDPELCNGCELCVEVCKRHAISVRDGLAVIDREECRHCGPCIAACPFDAIRARRQGFAAVVGGLAGEDTRLGQPIAEFLSEDEAFGLAQRCLSILQERKTRAATIIDEVGV
jgi:dissimilatory sulfite reductase (desulfoviridin) alpha/beta subunit